MHRLTWMTCYYTEPSLSLHQQGCLSPHRDQSSLVDLCTEVRSLPFAGFLLPSDVLPYPQKWVCLLLVQVMMIQMEAHALHATLQRWVGCLDVIRQLLT